MNYLCGKKSYSAWQCMSDRHAQWKCVVIIYETCANYKIGATIYALKEIIGQ